VGEIFGAYLKKNNIEIFDGIGDVQVVLIILEGQLDIERIDCCLNMGYWDKFATIEEILKEIFFNVNSLVYSYGITKDETYIDKNSILKIFLLLDFLSNRYNTTATRCLENAYNEIKNRKGKTVNGSFIREK
jgi:hypothetical protein